MKEFVKWLGVNEKIAKLVVWVFVIMAFLVLTNAMLDSVGFPHYQITYQNLKQIKTHKLIQWLANWFYIIVNFFAIVLLVFRVKEVKRIFKYALLYLVLNIIVLQVFNYVVTQVFIALFIIVFCYIYSGKNKKYILYSILSLVFNTVIQGLTYIYKVKLIDFTTASEFTKMILSLDYFIIMGIIILVKEIYLKKRSEFK